MKYLVVFEDELSFPVDEGILFGCSKVERILMSGRQGIRNQNFS